MIYLLYIIHDVTNEYRPPYVLRTGIIARVKIVIHHEGLFSVEMFLSHKCKHEVDDKDRERLIPGDGGYVTC